MPTFNVAAATVSLIEAPDEDTAEAIVRDRLARAGFEVYEGAITSPTGVDSFESEPLTPEVAAAIHEESK